MGIMFGLSFRGVLPLMLAAVLAACQPSAIWNGVGERQPLAGGGGGPAESAASESPAGGEPLAVVPEAKPTPPQPPREKPSDSAGGKHAPSPMTLEGLTGTLAPPQASPAPARPAPGAAEGRDAVPALQATPLPPVPETMPEDPQEVARLKTRPPMEPPLNSTASTPAESQTPPSGETPPAAAVTADGHCRDAVRAAREAINRYLDLPAHRIASMDWVEEALRVTEVAVRACRNQSGEEAATYWRATALFLHGQYARAALNYRRVADMGGPFNTLDYAGNLAEILQTCGDDRLGLDHFRLGGLYEAAGHAQRAAIQYGQAAQSRCTPLRETAEARLRLVAERLRQNAATR